MSISEMDTSVFFFVNKGLQNYLFDILMPFITQKAYILFLPVFFLKNKKSALVVLGIAVISFLITDGLANMLKHYFERTRPCNEFEAARILVNCTQSFSMPSNHAANAFAFSTPFLITFKDKLKYAFVVIAFFVSLSRVYVGVHYPSDIIVGGLVGTILAFSVNSLYKTATKRLRKKD